jgi:hypothetical protein
MKKNFGNIAKQFMPAGFPAIQVGNAKWYNIENKSGDINHG